MEDDKNIQSSTVKNDTPPQERRQKPERDDDDAIFTEGTSEMPS